MQGDLAVDAGADRTMRLHVHGSGPWTVLFDAGWGHWSPVWRSVQAGLAERHRTVAFDRLGLGASEAGSQPRSSYQIVDELQAALSSASLNGPRICVAHGFSAVHARVLAHRDPSVRALVLVEPITTVLGQSRAFRRHRRQLEARWSGPGFNPGRWLRPLRALALSSSEVRALPADARQELRRGVDRARLQQMQAEASALDESLAQLSTVGAPRVPCVVLSGSADWLEDGSPQPERETVVQAMHRKLAQQSPDGAHRIVEGSGHNLHIDHPEVVVAAVDELAGRLTIPAAPT